MANEFLGRGWRFPLLPDDTGSLGWCEGQANVEQSLRILLLTAVGERVMRPTFGTEAPQLVFAPGSDQYLRRLEQSIQDAVRDFEPRVDLIEVRAEPEVADPGTTPEASASGRAEARVTVSISYKVRRTNSRFNLVFPFYLASVEIV
ncbi:MAG TPA: GPW/gp25 family protein [Burkholderiaceae bacterium]|jgi:phage baseplate assembly protein W|nr:GPW/gp25 family protein [Burkholderiaceae bacterium]